MKQNGSLRRTLLQAFILVILILSVINLSTFRFFFGYYQDTEKMLSTLFQTTTISTMLGTDHQLVTNTINYQDEQYIEEFMSSMQETIAYTSAVDATMLRYARETGDMNAYYKFLDIQKAVLTYRDKSLVLIKQYNSGIVARANLYDALYELKSLKETVSDLQNELLFRQSISSREYYERSHAIIQRGVILLGLTTLVVLALCIFFSIHISRRVSLPIHHLAQAAALIGGGEHHEMSIPKGTNKEIGNLVTSFNRMSRQLQSRQDIERQLREREVTTLQMENLLRVNEMKLLQSRMHPHFLFNTLHMIVTLAQIEGARETGELIGSLSNLLRYIFKKADQQTTVAEELSIVTDYMNIQTTRFKDKISYRQHIDDNARTITLPALTLQPFVENSIIHGLEPMKGKGSLEISCRLSTESGTRILDITIEDNGVGIDPATLAEIQDVTQALKNGRHLGIANSIRRLELACPQSKVQLHSVPGLGTSVRIIVPLVVPGTDDVPGTGDDSAASGKLSTEGTTEGATASRYC